MGPDRSFVVFLDDDFRHIQSDPHTRPLLFGRKIGVEYLLEGSSRNPAAVIGDFDMNPFFPPGNIQRHPTRLRRPPAHNDGVLGIGKDV